jgi:hypothetical protein
MIVKKLIALVIVAGLLAFTVGCPAATTSATKSTGTGGGGGTGTGAAPTKP